jgi:hypothetical protein
MAYIYQIKFYIEEALATHGDKLWEGENHPTQRQTIFHTRGRK